MRYVLDFGSSNAGGSPAWSLFERLSDGAALSSPTVVEVGSGLYRFDYDATEAVLYKVALNGVELSDVIQPTAATEVPPTPTGGPNASGRFLTAGEILNRVASAVGLERVTDPYASIDPSFAQMRDLLLEAAGDVLNLKGWPQLVREEAVTTVEGQTAYDVPEDFRSFVPQTGWNRTARRPLGGPMSPQGWQKLLTWGSGSSLNVVFRLSPLQLVVYPSPPAGVEIAYEYQSKYWVQGSTETSASGDQPASSSDIVLFDDLLIVRALKLKWLQAKGFDTTVAATEYRDALESAMARAGGAPKLSLVRKVYPVGTHAVNEPDPFTGGVLY